MRILALSGSARRNSTNTALLRGVQTVAPPNVEIDVFDGVGRLPVFSPDLEADSLPEEVRAYVDLVSRSDGVLISSPEYVRALPGGLKNALDWLVSRDTLVEKPMALIHASHRGDDMLESLRIVLGTVSQHFAVDVFLRFELMKMAPAEIAGFIALPENAVRVQAYLRTFAEFCNASRR